MINMHKYLLRSSPSLSPPGLLLEQVKAGRLANGLFFLRVIAGGPAECPLLVSDKSDLTSDEPASWAPAKSLLLALLANPRRVRPSLLLASDVSMQWVPDMTERWSVSMRVTALANREWRSLAHWNFLISATFQVCQSG